MYTEKARAGPVAAAQGQVGIVNAKRIWQLNQEFWADKELPLQAGDDLRQHRHEEAGRPAVEVRRGVRRQRHRDQPAGHQRGRAGERPDVHPAGRQLPPADVLDEIDQKVDMQKMEETLMDEGIAKFADPQKALLKLIAEKRTALKIDGSIESGTVQDSIGPFRSAP